MKVKLLFIKYCNKFSFHLYIYTSVSRKCLATNYVPCHFRYKIRVSDLPVEISYESATGQVTASDLVEGLLSFCSAKRVKPGHKVCNSRYFK